MQNVENLNVVKLYKRIDYFKLFWPTERELRKNDGEVKEVHNI